MKPVPLSKSGVETGKKVARRREHPLDVFFTPNNIAVIGATENPGSVGRNTLQNLISSPFGGAVFPVNPKRSNVLGIKAYPNISSVPEQADLAVIITRPSTIPGIIRECGQNGVKGAIVISAGFKEMGPEGAALEAKLLEEAQRADIRIVGPNCLGFMCPLTGVNATFAAGMARPGNVGFISQSGALCTAVLDWSFRQQVGFSAFISLGSMLDVGWGDLIDYLGHDPRTRSILIYMESVGDARSFLSAAREVALNKPIIVIKAGRTAAGGKAAASHTGSMTGSDDVLDTAFRRSGVLRVNAISELFHMAEVLAKQPRPKGPRLTILTNAGGPGVLATDTLITSDGELAELSPETMEALNQVLPETWSRNNPIDVIGDATPERYAKALEIAAKDPHSDGLLVILTPQAMTDPTQIAEHLKPYARLGDKPVLASWMGGPTVDAGEHILNAANIPTFAYPDTAARMFVYMWRYSDNLRGLYETPIFPKGAEAVAHRALVEEIIGGARAEGRTILTEVESKQVLAAYGIPIVTTEVARSVEEAVAAAGKIGYPVVVKLLSETITHKTDVGGVKLDLEDPEAVREAWRSIHSAVVRKAGPEHFLGVTVQPMIKSEGYEVIVGSTLDPQFGPVILFGLGGILVEVFQDRALALPPLNSTLARRMMEQTKIYKAFKGIRGRKPVNMEALEQLMVHFSQLVAEQRWIKEIDINPLLVSSERLMALDARIVVHDKDVREEEIPKLAIRPYPGEYTYTWQVRGGPVLTLRPIRPEDEPAIADFHRTLSERTVYQRYMQMLQLKERVAHERLTRICFIDYDREIALVAEKRNDGGTGEIFGVGRLQKIHGTDIAEFAIVVSDAMQGKGLGTEFLKRLIEVARAEKMGRVRGDILAENTAMQKVCKKLGFRLKRNPGDPTVEVELDLA
jgi:acetyltransferase